MSSGEGKVVCVTGASGFIASWIIKLLLQRGYTVKATVRDPNDTKKTENLFALDGAKERLHLFKADLLEESSFDSAVDGCEGVFHTASPVPSSATDQKPELIDAALKGTLNVLKSCVKFPSIKRVIVTSAMHSVMCNGRPMNADVVVDETWFSDPAFCEKLKMWYALSKTLAEEAAWNFSKENGIDVVVMNPGLTIGPILQPTLSSSIKVIVNVINGVQTSPTSFHRFVDVRDVASAHIQALEVPTASGRYCLVESVTHCSETLKILHELCPTVHVYEKCEDAPLHKVSNEKAKSLGINFIPLEVSLKDTVASLKEKGFLNV